MNNKKYQGANHDGSRATSPYGLSTQAPATTLVDVAREIQAADNLIGHTASSKLQRIAEQMRALKAEAEGVLLRAKRDLDLHRATCSFSRTPGQIYHLYQRANEVLYWSMLSPEDWRGNPPHDYRGSYRLGSDLGWTDMSKKPGPPPPVSAADLVARLTSQPTSSGLLMPSDLVSADPSAESSAEDPSDSGGRNS